MEAEAALLAVGAAHAAFQVTVSAVVYPALLANPAAGFARAHEEHSRRISLVVGPLYLALVAVGAWTLLSGPSRWAVAAVLAHGVALLATALVAGPTHGRLGRGRTDALDRRLLRADLLRTAAALAGVALTLPAFW